MTLVPKYSPGKKCFVYCGPENCTCQRPKELVIDCNSGALVEPTKPASKEDLEIYKRIADNYWKSKNG